MMRELTAAEIEVVSGGMSAVGAAALALALGVLIGHYSEPVLQAIDNAVASAWDSMNEWWDQELNELQETLYNWGFGWATSNGY